MGFVSKVTGFEIHYLAISAATSASICCSLASLKVLNKKECNIGNIRQRKHTGDEGKVVSEGGDIDAQIGPTALFKLR